MDEQLDNDAIQDVLKRFTEELLNIVRRQAVQTQQARAQEMSTQDTQPTLDAVEITGTEETPPSTMESFQLQEQLTSLQAGVDAVLTDPSLDIKLPQVEDEHNLRSTVQELERLNGQGISIIEHLQSVVEQELNDLRSKVNQYEIKLERTRERLKKYKNKFKKMKVAKRQAKEELNGTRNELQKMVESAASAAFEATTFLGTSYNESVSRDHSLPSGGWDRHNATKNSPQSRTIDGALTVGETEIVWNGVDCTRFLVIYPHYQFNPALDNGVGRWERPPDQNTLFQEHRQRMNLFVARGETCEYKGAYECMGRNTISLQEAKEIGFQEVQHHIQTRTILSPEQVPPNIVKMVNQMYVQGVLKVECFGFRLVWADSPLGHSVNPDRSFFSVPSKKKPSKGDMSRPSKRKRANSLSEASDIQQFVYSTNDYHI